jgi:glycosyltransferase involved in cell wall biosynthesis
VEQHLLGLIHALGALEDPTTEYVIVTHRRTGDWLTGHLGPRQRVVTAPEGLRARVDRVTGALERRGRALGLPLPAGRLRLPRRAGRAAPGPDRLLETLGADVVHLAYQAVATVSAPIVFNPVDLQHLHHPEFFPAAVRAKREAAFRAGCRSAAAIAVASRHTKQDVVQHYGVAPDRVYVIPWAAATDLYGAPTPTALERVRRRYALPATFLLYPAQTWPHKNHLGLLEAVALLRDRHRLRVDLICTGAQNEYWPIVEARRRALGLEAQARFLGFVPADDLRCLYRLATGVVVPSLFESWGFPLFEAFREGAPVATAEATALGEYAGDAALRFDAAVPEAITEAVHRLMTDSGLRATLRARGCRQVARFTWERTARSYRALYRQTAGGALTADDRALLAAALASTDPGEQAESAESAC